MSYSISSTKEQGNLMANEITWDTATGLTLYACRWQKNGNVFLTNGASDEVWGTAGRDAADYAVTMTEEDVSGHYKGDFDTSGNIAEGIYDVTVLKQVGGVPANSDVPAIARGETDWDGTNEITLSSIPTVDEIWSKAMVDLAAGAPSATASVITAMNYIYEAWRNKTVTDEPNNEIIVYKDDGVTKLCESDISDDGTLFTKGEYGAPD